MALDLARLNTDRKELEAKMQLEALSLVDARVASLEGHVPAGVCVYDEGWHQGVIGLVASRVKERLHRPVIAFARSEPGWVKGSARSVPGVHVRDVLDAIATRTPGLVDKFGGHAMAAGLTLRESSLPVFEARVRARSRTLDRRGHAGRSPAHRRRIAGRRVQRRNRRGAARRRALGLRLSGADVRWRLRRGRHARGRQPPPQAEAAGGLRRGRRCDRLPLSR